jgi:hypothetical protein
MIEGYHRATGRTPMAIAEEPTATGISFALTDEQSDLRALAHEFAEKEIRPTPPSTTSTRRTRPT